MASPRDLLPRWLVDHHRSHDERCHDGRDEDGAAASSLSPPPHLTLAPWDDGFTPSGCDNRPCKIVTNQPKSTRLGVRVVDGAVHETTADLLYESAERAKVWGVYVPTRELTWSPFACAGAANESDVARRRTALQQQDEAAMGRDDKTQYRRALARIAVEEFLVAQGGDVITRGDWQSTHGVAVWVIASDCDDETEYHLDYAEMLRYETNVIFPPIYGATLHVSPLANTDSIAGSEEEREKILPLDGGAFHVNTRGLTHYDAYGYKTRRAPAKLSTDDLEAASTSEPDWQRVAYQYRRGIICDGELPHFSGRVRALPTAHKRVVVGFNLFPHEIGAFVEKFPEHSDAFNKHVKLSQTAAKQQQQRWTLESIKKNPKQAAFLKYLAKKVRQTQQQQQLSSPQQSQPHPPDPQHTQQVPAAVSTIHAV